jgi:Icc-related predicted phosphoesterase
MRIWHISDTHCLHWNVQVPEDIDTVVHSGDCSNSKDSALNSVEVFDFLDWFSALKVKNKIFVAGNHDVSIERRLITPDYIRSLGIIYLENESACVDGVNFWGSPITPSFGDGWAWNMNRSKIGMVWQTIPKFTDVIITHGPPKGILDVSKNFATGDTELCGCKSLATKIIEISPALCCFGHIHNSENFRNAGLTKLSGHDTIYSNGCCISDRSMELIKNDFSGNLLEIGGYDA